MNSVRPANPPPTTKPRPRGSKWPGIALTLAGLISLFAIANYIVPRLLISLTQAARSRHYSPTNSYIFASPIIARADGKQKIQVNVFLLDKGGYGVKDQKVNLTVLPLHHEQILPQTRAVQPITNEQGQAVFVLTANKPGSFKIAAAAAGIPLSQSTRIIFTAAD